MEEISKNILLIPEKKSFNLKVSKTSRNFNGNDGYRSSIFLTSDYLINTPLLCM